MKPPVNNRVAIVGGAQASASFGISVGNEAHIMGILRDTLYSDKVLAVLREYASNAWDAHRSVGKHELPISVTIPTGDEPTLRIRDWGPGLSRDDVFTVYTQYGASTKRDSDDAVGMLGIGSKSGFAYSDSFTITSWHGGTKSVYVAALDESEKGMISLLAEESCDASETGVEIQIAIKPSDIYDFERTARRLFRHFEPRPTINIELPALPEERTVLENGIITPGSDAGWIAIMGCVPYRVSLASLDEREVPRCLPHLSGTLRFGIGEVNINASREELKYSVQTKTALVAKLTALVDEYVTHALKELDAGTLGGWQTRLRCQVLAQMDLPLPEKWKGLSESFAKVTYTADDFVILHNKSACTRLMVSDSTCLLIDDTGNALDGYQFGHDDYVVRSANKTPDELRVVLDAVIATSGLTGVTIELLSSRHWTAPAQPKKRVANPKHRARMFKFAPSEGKYAAPWSDYWTPELRVPTKDDVFVLIQGFKARGSSSTAIEDYDEFFSEYHADALLAEAFDVTMPPVYAYKTTEKRPTYAKNCEGTFYRDWRKTFIKSLLTPERIELIATWWRGRPMGDDYNMQLPGKRRREWLTQELGDTHPLVELCVGAVDAEKATEDMPQLANLAGRAGLTWEKSEAYANIKALKDRYPLLRRAGFRELWGEGYYYDDNKGNEVRADWIDYVRLCDERAARAAGSPGSVVQLRSVP